MYRAIENITYLTFMLLLLFNIVFALIICFICIYFVNANNFTQTKTDFNKNYRFMPQKQIFYGIL